MTTLNQPCPICREPAGFHNLDTHAAVITIPANKLLQPGWQKQK